MLDRNLTGVFLCCRAAVPHMKARGWGRIVNVASESARSPIVPRTARLRLRGGEVGHPRAVARAGERARAVRHHSERGGARLHAQRPRIEAFYRAHAERSRPARVAGTKVKPLGGATGDRQRRRVPGLGRCKLLHRRRARRERRELYAVGGAPWMQGRSPAEGQECHSTSRLSNHTPQDWGAGGRASLRGVQGRSPAGACGGVPPIAPLILSGAGGVPQH